MAALGWSAHDLDPNFPPAVGFAGNRHPVLVAGDVHRLASLSYDVDAPQRLCRNHDWMTVQLVASTGRGTWRARDPFPWGGHIEVELLDRAALISGSAAPIEDDAVD